LEGWRRRIPRSLIVRALINLKEHGISEARGVHRGMGYVVAGEGYLYVPAA
jgi:hypothetical protein